MNFLWFHLMPYMDLPADFRQNNPSVWVNIDPALFDPQRAHQMYNDYFDELEYAAQVHRRLGCPVLEVSELSIEEISHRIMRLVEQRTADAKAHTS